MQLLNLKNDLPEVLNLGILPYNSARKLIREVIHPQIKGTDAVCIVFAEHPPTITLGKRISPEDVPCELQKLCLEREIEIIETDRGGQITFHAPGHLMIYPVLDLRYFRLSVRSYVGFVLQSVSLVLNDLQIKSGVDECLQGVWISDTSGKKKIASAGFRILEGLSDHGVSLYLAEINDEFSYFSPCGMSGDDLTSCAGELGDSYNSDIIKSSFYSLFPKYFLSFIK